MAEQKKKTFWLRNGTYFDYPTLFYIIFLVLFGLMMVYSAGIYASRMEYKNAYGYPLRQFIFSCMGLAIMYVVSRVRYQVIKKFTTLIVITMIVLLGLVLLIGDEVNGSTRWINLGFISFQPSEIAKIVVPLYMAYGCTDRSYYMYTWKGMLKLFTPVIAMVILIAVENLSTALICVFIAGGIWLIATKKYVYLIPVIIVGAIGIVILLNMEGYRMERLRIWRNPEEGYQTMQGLYAVGTGGFFGRGLGQSVQKTGKIPEAQNDMIFSIICEELGIVGAVGLIIVFVLLIWRMKFIAEGAPDRYGSLIVVGVLIHVAVQVIINMSVVTNVMPNTGVTLPFISYGGSSMIFLLAEMGLVLGVSRQIVPYGDEEESSE
ncbi:MAG: putative lipid II flippase FtsW [Eubacterium sp.]|nr:putative lipid II flippase FtsW [Eubacterium sp.]